MSSALLVAIANVHKEETMSVCLRCGLEIPEDEVTEEQICAKCKEIRKNGKIRRPRKVDTRYV